MALAHKTAKRIRRPTQRAPRTRSRPILDTRQMVKRIDAMIRELETMRRQLTQPKRIAPPNLVDQLFGVLGHGTWDEYDLDLDWKRFSEWQLR